MKAILGYANVTLVDTLFIRGKQGRFSDASGPLPSPGDKAIYNLKVQQMTVDGEKGNRQVRIADLRCGAKVPMLDKNGGFQYVDTGLTTSLDVREGQRVVVGKAGLDTSSNPIFLVVSCKIAE